MGGGEWGSHFIKKSYECQWKRGMAGDDGGEWRQMVNVTIRSPYYPAEPSIVLPGFTQIEVPKYHSSISNNSLEIKHFYYSTVWENIVRKPTCLPPLRGGVVGHMG